MNIILQKSKKVNKYGCDIMWLKRIIGLGCLTMGIGIMFALFMPISVLFFIISVILVILGFIWLFC